MFLEKRVYQGSSGKVYPLPFIDRISETKSDVEWDAVHLENEFLYVMILPPLGGRIHVLRDKTNGYDLVYNQPVIKSLSENSCPTACGRKGHPAVLRLRHGSQGIRSVAAPCRPPFFLAIRPASLFRQAVRNLRQSRRLEVA